MKSKLNISTGSLALFLLLAIWIEGFMGASDQISCFQCRVNITEPPSTVPNCKRTTTNCSKSTEYCGITVRLEAKGSVNYRVDCIPHEVCAVKNVPRYCEPGSCYVHCCENEELCNNYTTNKNVFEVLRAFLPTTSSTLTASSTRKSIQTGENAGHRFINQELLFWVLAAWLAAWY